MLKSTNYGPSTTLRPPLLFFNDLPLAVADLLDTLPSWARSVIHRIDAPERKGWYHNIDHIAFMWDAYTFYGDGKNQQAVALFIAFHDAIYQPGAPYGKNERLSADLLDEAVNGAGETVDVDGEVVDIAYRMICSTIQGNTGTDRDALLARDLDLYCLALPIPAYKLFVNGLYEERYSVESNHLLAKATQDKIIANFCIKQLDKSVIYRAGIFPSTHDWYAAANLVNIMQYLPADGNPILQAVKTKGQKANDDPHQMIRESELLFTEALRVAGTSRPLSLARTNMEQARMWFDEHYRIQAKRSADLDPVA
jgi:predicted metal-dependent HD superfamily phosphohydrolase